MRKSTILIAKRRRETVKTMAGIVKQPVVKHYDTIYQGNKQLWGNGHRPELDRLLEHTGEGNGRSALDVGFGNGQNLIFLAKHGFQVSGIEISEQAKGNTEANMKDSNVKGNLLVRDITTDGIFGQFDCIMSAYTLNFVGQGLDRESASKKKAVFVQEMMDHTIEGGYNFLLIFTKEATKEKSVGTGERFTSVDGRIREFYESKGWQIVEYSEFKGENLDKKETGNTLLIARKREPGVFRTEERM